MADTATEIDLDSVIDRLLEGELARLNLSQDGTGSGARWAGAGRGKQVAGGRRGGGLPARRHRGAAFETLVAWMTHRLVRLSSAAFAHPISGIVVPR